MTQNPRIINDFPISGSLAFGISDSAADAVRLKFNPSADDDVARIKMFTAGLITHLEYIRDRDGGKAGREAAVAITQLQTASMWSVLAATKGFA